MIAPHSLLIPLLLLSTACVGKPIQSVREWRPLVIGHRGASGQRPEHTRASYELAIEQGADFIEPDLVMTKDKVLVARHENEISQTTDVAQKFPNRKRKKNIDGETVEGWFTEDFTFAEIKTLRARERLNFRDQSYNGQFDILSFEEVLAIAQASSRRLNRPVGIYPELKHPSYFKGIGMDLGSAVIATLNRYGWNKKGMPVFIQSFELTSLKDIRHLTPLPLVFLVDELHKRPYDFQLANDPRTYGELMRPEELKKLSATINGIGPWKQLIRPLDSTGAPEASTTLVADAHQSGLFVHAYTFRSDKEYLPPPYQGDPTNEYLEFCRLGVDGFFTDFPAHAIKGLRECQKNSNHSRTK